MFKKNYESLVERYELADPAKDIKQAKQIGKYKVSSNAIYRPDNKYFNKAAITEVIQDKGSVQVTGCCIGVVPTDRLILIADKKPFTFDFDSEKQVMKAKEMLGI